MSLRLRLTLLYGACFLIAGAALLGITYALFTHSQANVQSVAVTTPIRLPGRLVASPVLPGAKARRLLTHAPPGTLANKIAELRSSAQQSAQMAVRALATRANVIIHDQHSNSRSSLLLWSAVALAVMALVSVLLGWLLAGRALAPLRTMNRRARAISAENLHQRLGPSQRRDELGDLAATFDALLGRLESAFESQRGFVANASHELRTPLTLERALLEVALADPDPSVESLRYACGRVLLATESQERLIESLLVLARGQAGLTKPRPVDLPTLTRSALDERAQRLAELMVTQDLREAVVAGDEALLERLVANLIDNAIVHNVTGGWIRVSTGRDEAGRASLTVANGGEQLSRESIAVMSQPFRRLGGVRTGDGLGLGLSIVTAIATAHGAELSLNPEPGGGLTVSVAFTPEAVRDPAGTQDPHPAAVAAF